MSINELLSSRRNVLLRFTLDTDTPLAYVKRWNELKKKTETTNNKFLFECFIGDNNGYKYLNRMEGGMELDGKQLRFRYLYGNDSLDNDIKTQYLDGWSLEELDHFLVSFIKIFNETYDLGNGIRGTIELEPLCVD